MDENFIITLADFQKDICSSSAVFAENLQTVLNISNEEAEDIVKNLPYEINNGMSKNDALKLAELLEAFGAIVNLQDALTRGLIAEIEEPTITEPIELDSIDLEYEHVDLEEEIVQDLAEEIAEEITENPEVQTNSKSDEALFGSTGVESISFDLELDEPEELLFTSPVMEAELALPIATNDSLNEKDIENDLEDIKQESELSNISLSTDDEQDLSSGCEIQSMITLSTEKDSEEIAKPFGNKQQTNTGAENTLSKVATSIVATKKAETKVENQSEVLESPECSSSTSPFLEKKRSLAIQYNKYVVPSIVAFIALLGAVFFFSSAERPTTALSIDVNSELVKTLLDQGQSAKTKDIMATLYSNFEGKLSSEIMKIDARVNKANDKIENLKISLQGLTDKLTTADEFITNKFYPHLNSLEVEIKDTQGTKIEDWFSFKGSARVFYMFKNISSKGILDVYINIKGDNSELIISNAPTTTSSTSEMTKPELLDSNGKIEFQAFSINIPLNSVTLAVPIRKVLSSTELEESPEPDKKKNKKKDKIKSVDG